VERERLVGSDNATGLTASVDPGQQPADRSADRKAIPDPSDPLVGNFFAFDPGLRDGAYLAVGDVLGNGQQDLILGPGAGGPSEVEVISGAALVGQGAVAAITSPVASFTPSGLGANGAGLRVATVPTGNGDQVNVAAGTGRGRVGQVQVYLGTSFGMGTGEPGGSQLLDPFGGSVLTDGVFVG
jgi:hypothetical protein